MSCIVTEMTPIDRATINSGNLYIVDEISISSRFGVDATDSKKCSYVLLLVFWNLFSYMQLEASTITFAVKLVMTKQTMWNKKLRKCFLCLLKLSVPQTAPLLVSILIPLKF